jgi:3-oxoacyl-[acyl-carrier protein] reductase
MPGLFDVSKEIILVTGASQGLGRQFARLLSAHGARHDRWTAGSC